jgi:hypothetical protein
MAGTVVRGMEILAGAARGQGVEAIVTASRLADTTEVHVDFIARRPVDSAVARFAVAAASTAVDAGNGSILRPLL